MQRIVYILFISIFLLEFLNTSNIIPRPVTYIPELISAFIVISIVFHATKQRTFILTTGYWIIFILFIVSIAFSAIMNWTPSGAVFAGIRAYFKYIPLFFLPAIYNFSDEQMMRQFKLLLALSVLQFPVALYQKFVLSAGLITGDLVGGTVGNSGTLSIYLICSICILLGFYIKGYLTRFVTLILLLLLAIPTMINETKATLFMMPIAAFMPVLTMPSGPKKLKALWTSLIIFIGFMVLFIPIYDYYMVDRYGYGLFTFLTMEGRLIGYLAPNLSGHNIYDVGRFDSMILFIKALSDDPVRIIMGLGIGNVSESFLGDKFSGEYLLKYGKFAGSSLSLILIEMGLIGIILMITLFIKLFLDSKILARQDDICGAIALGWTGVILLIFFGLFYSELIPYNTTSYLFWYLSGYIAVTASKVKLKQRVDAAVKRHNRYKRF